MLPLLLRGGLAAALIVSALSPGATARAGNVTWTCASELVLDDDGGATAEAHLDRPVQSRWYKFAVEPNSEVNVAVGTGRVEITPQKVPGQDRVLAEATISLSSSARRASTST